MSWCAFIQWRYSCCFIVSQEQKMVDSIRYAVTDWEMYFAQMTVPYELEID